MILLYEANETEFSTNGIGALSDAVSCVVTEERNGAFELVMEYPITGIHYSELEYRKIIFAKPNPFDRHQPFRIYRITRPINGLVTVYAWHVSYDLNGIPVIPFHTYTLDATLSALTTNASVANIFSYSTDKPMDMEGEVNITSPLTIRNVLGGVEGSILQTYRGEYKFDRFNVSLLASRGQNNGVVLRYGKNLVNLTQDENFATNYTGIAPYWVGESTVYLPEVNVYVQGSFDFERILPVDFSQAFETEPSEEDLRSAAQAYIESNSIGVPNVSVSIDYVMDSNIEQVRLCDTVGAIYSALGVQVSAKCVRTEFDALTERYNSITLGSIMSNFADNYAKQTQNLTNRIRSIESDYTTVGEARSVAVEEIANDTTILQRAEGIIASALEQYVLTNDFETFRSSILTEFSILAGEVNIGFTNTATDISTLSGQTQQEFNSIYSFIRLLAEEADEHGTVTQEGGIVIGESTSEIKLKLVNDTLYFFTGDEKLFANATVLAYFAANRLYVNNTTIENLTLGTTGAYLDARIVGQGDNVCVLWSGRL